MELWEEIYPEDIAEKMLQNASDMDSADYEETRESEKEDIVNALYQLKAICENPYNSDYYRTFFNALVRSLSMEY